MKASVFYLSIFFLSILYSCTNSQMLSEKSLIPIATTIIDDGKQFKLKKGSSICINDSELQNTAQYLAQCLQPSTGFKLPIIETNNPKRGDLVLIIDTNKKDWNKEEYELKINTRHSKIIANHPEGIVRGIQTLRQVFPATIESETSIISKWRIPTGTIHDAPKYEYRGAMLDVARHFFTVNEVKRYIDLIALYKINHLHLHLSDDQGWRIEIKSWPKLTEIGGSSSVNNEKPGYYSQEDYIELIDYAQQRFITIIPEIDLPGHTNAALASYAELNEDNKATELYSGTKVGFSSLAIHKEITYEFIDDVIRELALITPGPYIHIGGDESHSTDHDDYAYFMNKALDIVSKYDKKAIGWDEMAHANVNSSHTVQFWSNKENTALGLKKGTKVIFSPAKYAYLDMKYDTTTTLGLKWAGTIEVDKAYNWLPDTIIQSINQKQILGVEAPLWSETIKTNADIEYLAFPRLCGIAEIGWSQNSALNWEEYKTRLAKQKERFEILGINYYQSPVVDWELPEDK